MRCIANKRFFLLILLCVCFVRQGVSLAAEDPGGLFDFRWGDSPHRAQEKALFAGFVVDESMPEYTLSGGAKCLSYVGAAWEGEVYLSLIFFENRLIQVGVESVESDEILFNELRSELSLQYGEPTYTQRTESWDWLIGDSFLSIGLAAGDRTKLTVTSNTLFINYSNATER